MSNSNQINFQISVKNKAEKNRRDENSSAQVVRRAINSICNSICDILSDKQAHILVDTIFTIRYLKNEIDSSSAVRTYFTVSRSQNSFSSDEIDVISSNVEAILGSIFKLSPCQLDWQDSICSHAVSQIIKDEFFDLDNNLYVPKFLKAANSVDLSQAINFMESQSSKIALEICLQPYHALDERVRWMKAIDEMIQVTRSDKSPKSFSDQALKEYQAYQKYYSRDTTLPSLFNYSIKAYGEKQSHVQALLNMFRDSAIHHKNTADCLVVSLNSQTSSLVKVGEPDEVQRYEWQNSTLVNTPIRKIIQPVKKGWDQFGNDSLNIDNWLATGIGLREITSTSNLMQALSEGSNHPSQDGQIVSSKGGQMAHNQRQAPITIADLKPLHQIVCMEEIQGFLHLGVSDKIKDAYPTMTAEEMFQAYRHLITPDTYIVGLDDQGNIITSNWETVPHRLLAGATRKGKTNFLHWLLFQFLYANPSRKIYIADFKGVDFSFLPDLNINLNIATTVEECQAQVAAIQNDEFLARQKLMGEYKVAKLKALQKELKSLRKEEINIDRTIWIIDEAADIADASTKVKNEIENSLKKYARQGASYGIQVVYCTQRVSTTVITPQVTDQCEEKVIFKLKLDASQIVLDDPIASEIPMDAKGRAVLDSPEGQIFVNTPFIQPPEGTSTPISATLWKHIQCSK